jgi:hypothetical protein
VAVAAATITAGSSSTKSFVIFATIASTDTSCPSAEHSSGADQSLTTLKAPSAPPAESGEAELRFLVVLLAAASPAFGSILDLNKDGESG